MSSSSELPTQQEVSSETELADVTEGTPFVDALKKSPLYNRVSAILHWHDPVQSALLFGIGNFFFFLITYGEYTVLSLLAYLTLSLLTVAGVYANGTLLRAYIKKERHENPFSAKLKKPFVMTEDDAKPHVDAFVGVVNDFVHLARHAIYFTDTVFSIKVAVIVWFIALVGSMFSGVFILYAIFLAAFIWPRIYQEKQAEIDRVSGIALSHLDQYYALILSKLPLHKKKKED